MLLNKIFVLSAGAHILEEHLKNLLTSLRDTMDKLQVYEDQLNDFMLSNFNFIKTDSENLVDYVPEELLKSHSFNSRLSDSEKNKHMVKVKYKNDDGDEVEEEVQVEQALSGEKTNEFFKRAEVQLKVDSRGGPAQKFNSISEKTEHLKNLKLQIEKESKGAPGAKMADIVTAQLLARRERRCL